MDKSELLSKLQDEVRNWKSLLERIGAARMEKPGVNGDWSIKDLVAHLTGWNRWLVTRLQAALHGEPEPPTPWPADRKTDDEINTWIHESHRDRSLQEVLDETDQVLQELLVLIKGLPADVRIEHIEPASFLVWLGDERFPVGEFFEHFYEDHERDVRAWLEREENR